MVLTGKVNYDVKRGSWEDHLKNARPMTYAEKMAGHGDLYQRNRNAGVEVMTKQEDELFWMDVFREMDAKEKARYASGKK